MKKINHIVISGNIGVGKTTLSEKISKKFNWELQLEEVKDNPYLDDFYKSMKDWSFHLQIFFLNSRFNQIQKISESNNVVIQDRSIYEDYEVFTLQEIEELNEALGTANLTENEIIRSL
mgnify:CR=1 FL=1